MGTAFFNLIPTFSPVSIQAIDTFSNEKVELKVIDELNDWLYEEKSHYLSYSQSARMASDFVTLYNEFVASGNETAAMEFCGTTYTVTTL